MATAATTSAAVAVRKWGCGGRNLRRRAMQLQLRGPQKSAPQRNSSFEHQLATSERMASAPMGVQHTCSNCSKCTRVIAERAWRALKRAYFDAGFFGPFFLCAMRQNMQKPCPQSASSGSTATLCCHIKVCRSKGCCCALPALTLVFTCGAHDT
jgi:hypothetical protein